MNAWFLISLALCAGGGFAAAKISSHYVLGGVIAIAIIIVPNWVQGLDATIPILTIPTVYFLIKHHVQNKEVKREWTQSNHFLGEIVISPQHSTIQSQGEN